MTIEVSAKKVEDAISQGLSQLGATLDEVSVEVIDSGGLFRKAKVRLTLEKEEEQVEGSQAKEEPTEKQPIKAEEIAPQETEKPVKADAEKPEKAVKPAAEKTVKPEKPIKKAEAEKQSNPPVKKASKAPSEKKPQAKAEAGRKDERKSAEADVENVKNADRQKGPQAKSESGNIKDAERRQKRPPREEDIKAQQEALGFIKDITAKMGFEVTVEADGEDAEKLNITAPAGDDSLIIGRHGETLSALSYLAETVLRAEKNHVNVTVDCNGYRARRAASLSAMARRRADECVRKGRRIKLEPMERADRRTVHYALGDDDRVTTASEGKEPYRYVVIMPTDKGRQARQSDE